MGGIGTEIALLARIIDEIKKLRTETFKENRFPRSVRTI